MSEKNYAANKLQSFMTEIRWSTPENPVCKLNEIDPECPVMEYYAAYMETAATPIGETMNAKRYVIQRWMGNPKLQAWTPQEVYNAAKNYNTMNIVVANDAKTVWKETINQDIA